MEKVRIGNDIQVKYTVLRDGQPESFAGATNIVVTVKNEAYGKIIPSTFSILNNVVTISLDAADCVLCGKHRVTLSYNRGNDITIDALAFELVQFTSQTGGTDIVGVEIVTVNISGDIGIAIPDNNKIDLDGLNSNIDKLHFKPDTLVALAEVGDVRYSPESKTLEVKVSDTVSIQLGQEMQTRVKNDEAIQINNGQMVYINSAVGANPLAKIASTSNADIAQRTFGMATENIAANGFGAITTEGLVRDVNTSAFPEGAMLWLGTNGSVTNIEPVAPVSKISVGMVLRSNANNGVVYVKIRAIARNQKLSDVYAPTMSGGDILRWNSTTLRFETFNITTALAGKADLVGGKIPTSQLPSYVDDVLEYANLSAFPATGETGKIYLTLDTNLTYRWSGTAYVEISKSLALGETSSTAYRGDRGKTAYDHSQATGNVHGTTASQIPNTPAGTVVSTTVQGAINELASDIVQVETDLNYMYPSVGTAKRILADAGTIKSRSALNELTNKFLDLLPNTKLLFCPHLAVKLRESGIYKYVTKLYDIGPGMLDGAQTTALNQPYLSGNIAPNEKYAIKSVYNTDLFVTHTPISFLSTDKWSISTVLNVSAHTGNIWYISGNRSTVFLFGIEGTTGRFSVYIGGVQYTGTKRFYSYYGKNTIVTLTSFGNNILNIYVNGALFEMITTPTNITAGVFGSAYVQSQNLKGTISYHCIREIALSTTQVQDEYNYLRSIFPEVESVQIGTQMWATSNCEMTCTPQGNVIAEMQVATNVEIITNAADREFSSDTGFWTKGEGWIINGGTATRSGSGGTALYRSSLAAIIGKRYKITYTISSSFSTAIYVRYGAVNGPTRSAVGTYVEYVTAVGSGGLEFWGTGSGSIDNVSLEEVGWSDSANLYNYIYANTTGTAEQKEYAAVKAAAMWCYYNNDPALGSIYGKLYNWYAVKLLQMDIDYYNVANPTALWGWRVPTSADFTTLSTYLGGDSVAGGKLKKEGLDYWNTPNMNANNQSGFSAIGSGFRISNGSFVNTKNMTWLMNLSLSGRVCLTTKESLDSSASLVVDSGINGGVIRLIKS